MKAKPIIILLLLNIWMPDMAAQDTSKCDVSFRDFEEMVDSGNYDNALASLDDLMLKCPKFDEKIYTYGEKALNNKIESGAGEKQEYINALLALYSQYDLHYPENKNGNSIKTAMLMRRYELAPDEDVFKLLDTAYKKNKPVFTDYEALEAYFSLYTQQYENKKSGITLDQFLEKYGDVSGQVLFAKNTIAAKRAQLLEKEAEQPLEVEDKEFLIYAETSDGALEAVRDNIDMQASKYLNCDRLEAHYEKSFETSKGDAGWLEAMVSALYNNRCFNSAILLKGALALFELKPSSESAYKLGNIYLKRRNQNDAINYFEKSEQLEANPVKKATLNYELAVIFRNIDKALARQHALKAVQLNPKSGRPYLLLAEMYTSTAGECELSDFERKALVWLAVETVMKAEAAEPKYKPTVATLLENYSKKAPTKTEAKKAKKKKGDTITYGCWINETVTVPKL